jgi:hypothetical protein
MNIHIYLGCFLGLFQVSVDILGRSRVSTVTQQQFFEKTFTSLSLEKKNKSNFLKHSRPTNSRQTHNHEQDECLEDLRGQVHGRSVGEIVDNETKNGSCS